MMKVVDLIIRAIYRIPDQGYYRIVVNQALRNLKACQNLEQDSVISSSNSSKSN